MTGKHRSPEDDEKPGKITSLLAHSRADVVISLVLLACTVPFGVIAVVTVGVMILLAWFI